MATVTDINDMTLEECIKGFLELTMLEPEKPPKTQRAQRENRMLILGFNRAQEALRTILKTHGVDETARALGKVRRPGQEQPMEGPGGMKMWIV